MTEPDRFRYTTEEFRRTVVQIVIAHHPKDCIFTPDAENNIVNALAVAKDEESFINICDEALRENEIYCPHEGIDRRKEFGLL